jgi:hypothetical protein
MLIGAVQTVARSNNDKIDDDEIMKSEENKPLRGPPALQGEGEITTQLQLVCGRGNFIHSK